MNETELIQTIIDRLRAKIPGLSAAVIRYPDKPAQLTKATIDTYYPHGLLMVQFVESDGGEGRETITFGVCVLGTDLDRVVKLCRAVKIVLNFYEPEGVRRFEFALDKPMEGEENGVISRLVCFTTIIAAVGMPEEDIDAAITALGL
jgi:hypothetical protein